MNIIFDKKIGGSLQMFRLKLTNKYHICFMKNNSYMNGKKGYTISFMKKYREEGAYTPVFNILKYEY